MPSDSDERRTLPPAMTDQSTHTRLLRLLRGDFPAGGAGRSVLDAPCGAGALSVGMRDLGFAVQCCDIDPGHFEGKGFHLTRADLARPLPFRDARFDLVVSIAGLQRITFPHRTVAEFWRVVKPGGRLYLGVPNFATLRRRLRVLLYGSMGPRFDRPAYKQTLDAPEANFRAAWMYPHVEHMVASAGFALRAVVPVRDEMGYPLVLWPLALAAWTASRCKALLNPAKYAAYRRSTTFGMLGSNSYIVVADRLS